MATEKPSCKRFCSTGLASDIEIQVDDVIFHLHKFPLMSKSRKLNKLITEHEQEEKEKGYSRITLEKFPGGWEIFEMAVKMWYGVKVELCASTAVALRCAAQELEMTEEYYSQMDKYLSECVFSSIQESIKALKACESAESLGLTQQCIDSIVSIAENPSFFGWPINAHSKQQSKHSWLEDLAELSFPMFKRLIQAMTSNNLNPDIVERSLIHYAKKHIPGVSRSSIIASEKEQRMLLEIIMSDLLPLNHSSTTSTVRSLFGLLRSSIILRTSEKCRTVLERKIGSQLEKATLDDLLIPSYSYLNETLYDVDLVERLLRHFLQNASSDLVSLTLVGKLIDGVLGEVALDANLKPEKFYNLAVSLPAQARLYDDAIYRAIDTYLKAHPWILETERDKICSVMDCRKLTLEACTHAAQNERLPLRAVVNVLFLDNLHLREGIFGTEEDGGETVGEEQVVDFERWKKTVKENQVLRLDIDTMRRRVHQLERECLYLKNVIVKLEKESSLGANDRSRRWSISKSFGCKFKTQVCDSHEVTLVGRRSSRSS